MKSLRAAWRWLLRKKWTNRPHTRVFKAEAECGEASLTSKLKQRLWKGWSFMGLPLSVNNANVLSTRWNCFAADRRAGGKALTVRSSSVGLRTGKRRVFFSL